MFPNSNSLPRFIYSFMKKRPIPFLVFYLSPMVVILETAVMPYTLKMIIDTLTHYAAPRADVFKELSLPLWIYALSWIVIVLIARLQNAWQAYVFPAYEADIRMSSLAYILGHSYRYFSTLFSGNVANKIRDLTKSIDKIGEILRWNIVSSASAAIATLILMATINFWCALVLGLWIIVHLLVILYFGKYTHIKAEKNAEDKSALSGSIVDVLTNIASVKLFSNSKRELKYISKQQKSEMESYKQLILNQNWLRLGMDLPVMLLMFFLLYFLIRGWQQNQVTVGDIAFVVQSSSSVMNHMWFLGQALTELFQEVGIAKQGLNILQHPQEIKDKPGAKPLVVKKGKIEFNNVSFHYQLGKTIFQNKNVIIQPGTKVGLVGFSGSGKTTFVHLIQRFFQPSQGNILIDQQNIQTVTQDSLMAAISTIPQDTALFHRTLMENIRYGKPEATDEEVIQASIKAHCHEFIMQFDEGYETMVGERGMKLSGGQRQRIAIARAILKNAPIVILDEATSALDSITEKQIQESLQLVFRNHTTIVIAHRLSTLDTMDRILVFDKGQIVEDGTHQALIQQDGHYAHLWKMQTAGFLPDAPAPEFDRNTHGTHG